MHPRDQLKATLDQAKLEHADLPRTRESALVLTKIDEALLWLLAHMAVEDNTNG